jgi:hypothetical protein
MALISDGMSMIPKMLKAAYLAFPTSGPNYCAFPEAIAPVIIAKMAIKMDLDHSIMSVISKSLSFLASVMNYWMKCAAE